MFLLQAKRITANSHTPEEVAELLKEKYGAVEASQQSYHYLEQKKCLKASLILHYRPDLLGDLADLKPPETRDMEALKVFLEADSGTKRESGRNSR